MSSDQNTTVSVERETTYKELRRRRNDLDDLEPGGRVSMDDVIQDALSDRERLRDAQEHIEELERTIEKLRQRAEAAEDGEVPA